MFRKLKGVSVPYKRQGLIYFTCVNYQQQPQWMQRKIDKLCQVCGGEYAEALKALMTEDGARVDGVAMRYHVSEGTLIRCRKRFYEEWR
jgi:hypothetical protein